MSIVIKVNPYKPSSIQKAIDDLRIYKRVLSESPSVFIDAICERLNEILSEQAPDDAKGMWVYETVESDNGHMGVFRFQGEVEFIEFGTGIVGKEHHDGANMEWAEKLPPPYTGYESGHYINLKTHEWRYWSNGKWVVTTGREADPFIYRSVEQVLEESSEIARRVLRKR
jgi:hypothetical protein